jgi:hypothetical protein
MNVYIYTLWQKGLYFRISERRLNKLCLLAIEKDKIITQILEYIIDTLPYNLLTIVNSRTISSKD